MTERRQSWLVPGQRRYEASLVEVGVRHLDKVSPPEARKVTKFLCTPRKKGGHVSGFFVLGYLCLGLVPRYRSKAVRFIDYLRLSEGAQPYLAMALS